MFLAPRRVRRLWILAGALQLVMPGTATLADSLLYAETAHTYPHVHVPGKTGCPRVHADDCALCRVISAPALTTQTNVPVATRDVQRYVSKEDVGTLFRFDRQLPQSRAPPLS